jgi:hypothetical protein
VRPSASPGAMMLANAVVPAVWKYLVCALRQPIARTFADPSPATATRSCSVSTTRCPFESRSSTFPPALPPKPSNAPSLSRASTQTSRMGHSLPSRQQGEIPSRVQPQRHRESQRRHPAPLGSPPSRRTTKTRQNIRRNKLWQQAPS